MVLFRVEKVGGREKEKHQETEIQTTWKAGDLPEPLLSPWYI